MVLDDQVGAIIYVRGTRILYFKSEEKTNGDTFFFGKNVKRKTFYSVIMGVVVCSLFFCACLENFT